MNDITVAEHTRPARSGGPVTVVTASAADSGDTPPHAPAAHSGVPGSAADVTPVAFPDTRTTDGTRAVLSEHNGGHPGPYDEPPPPTLPTETGRGPVELLATPGDRWDPFEWDGVALGTLPLQGAAGARPPAPHQSFGTARKEDRPCDFTLHG